MMTMFVMTMGELNYHEYFTPWENLAFSTLTNILFIVLVLGMPIIMMNMLVRPKMFFLFSVERDAFCQGVSVSCELRFSLIQCQVGLAVGDIDKIQQNALMDRYVKQVRNSEYYFL